MTRIILLLSEIRTYQWVKNVLIFVPCIASHTLLQSNNIENLVLSFLAFSLVASAGYILNDVIDLDQDRQHPDKRHRPLAAGTISLRTGIIAHVIILFAGLALAAIIDQRLPGLLGTYFICSVTYSVFLKRLFLADVITLALLYTFRVYVGAVIGNIVLSKWLTFFSILLFLGLAVMKRYGDLERTKATAKSGVKNLYRLEHGATLKLIGFSATILSGVVFGLYLFSPEVTILYTHPLILLVALVCIEGWLVRMWYFAIRGGMSSDPIIFALRDPVSYLAAILMLVSVWAAV